MVIRGNFIGAAIVAIIYTVYILNHTSAFKKPELIAILVVLNALTIVLMAFAFK
jgi:hypothetical protein